MQIRVPTPKQKMFNRPCTPQNSPNKYYNNYNNYNNYFVHNIGEDQIKTIEKKEKFKSKIIVPAKNNTPSKIRTYLQNGSNYFTYRGNNNNLKDGDNICNIYHVKCNNMNMGNKGKNIYIKKLPSKNKY